MPISRCFNYYSFKIYSENQSFDSVLFFPKCLWSFSPVKFLKFYGYLLLLTSLKNDIGGWQNDTKGDSADSVPQPVMNGTNKFLKALF